VDTPPPIDGRLLDVTGLPWDELMTGRDVLAEALRARRSGVGEEASAPADVSRFANYV